MLLSMNTAISDVASARPWPATRQACRHGVTMSPRTLAMDSVDCCVGNFGDVASASPLPDGDSDVDEAGTPSCGSDDSAVAALFNNALTWMAHSRVHSDACRSTFADAMALLLAAAPDGDGSRLAYCEDWPRTDSTKRRICPWNSRSHSWKQPFRVALIAFSDCSIDRANSCW